MSTHEVSVEDVPQRNELVVDEGGSQDISVPEAVEEPPAKTSKIVEEALKNFEYPLHSALVHWVVVHPPRILHVYTC